MDGDEPDINIWLGPKGTVSPAHYDPKNNFLTQVCFKTIIREYRIFKNIIHIFL